MGENTNIGPNDHSSCVESTPPLIISPEDLLSKEKISKDGYQRK